MQKITKFQNLAEIVGAVYGSNGISQTINGTKALDSITSTKAPSNKITVYRVDDINFAPRISENGQIPTVTNKKGNERALFLNFGDAAKLNPTNPIVVDINKGKDQYGLRKSEQIDMFRKALDPSTVRLIPLDSKKVPKK